MAIIFDKSARAALDRRRASGKDTSIFLRLERFSRRAWAPYLPEVSWAPRRWPASDLVVDQVGDVAISMDTRLARYVRWNDVVVSAWKLGPLARLVLADPFLAFHLEEWEQSHPLPKDICANRLPAPVESYFEARHPVGAGAGGSRSGDDRP